MKLGLEIKETQSFETHLKRQIDFAGKRVRISQII